MLFGTKKIEAFGLDISNVSIKTMQLKKLAGGFFPVAYSDHQIPASLIAQHIITNEEKLSEHIRRAVSAAKIQTKYVIASIPEAKSFVRILKMPKMSDQELDGAIPWELEQDIPIPVDQVYLDWQAINDSGNKIDILVTATPKDYVDVLVSALKLAGLKPVALELESQATARALVSPEDAKQAVLILDMASALTSFIIVENGVIQYTSNIPIAGSAFTESIARNLGISHEDGEKIKRDIGLLGESKKGNARQAILPLLDTIIDEIKNVVRFHEEHSVTKKLISKVILCGGTARLSGITDYISARLNLGTSKPVGRVILGNPWINLAPDTARTPFPVTKEQSLSYVTVAGLALRGVNN